MVALEEIGPVSLSLKGTEETKTGRWSRLRPIPVERTAPCQDRCPGSIPVNRFIRRLQEEDLQGAWEAILEANPMPRITGRVCFHPCEEGCNRGGYDEPIMIHGLERFVGDSAFEKGFSLPAVEAKGEASVAVVGSGPAGLACAFYLSRLGCRVSIFEAMEQNGGLLRYGIPEYRLPQRVLDEELERILSDHIEVRAGMKVGDDVSWEELTSQHQAVFIGIGAQKASGLGLRNEEEGGILDGIRFLQAVSRGETPVDPGRKVLIIGGGNTAIDVARTVLRLKGVPTVLYRRTREEMPAFEDEIREAEEEGIEIRFLVSPVTVVRDQGAIKGLQCVQNRSAAEGPDGRRGFEPVPGSAFFVEGEVVVAATGHAAELEGLPTAVGLDAGALMVEENGHCGSGLFWAGGDATGGPRSVIHALAAGRRAAFAIGRRLQAPAGIPEQAPDQRSVVGLEEINLAYFERAAREKPPTEPAGSRVLGFKEVTGVLSEEACRREASRCFLCGSCNTCGNCYFFCPDLAFSLEREGGKLVIDYEYCKGCCICVEECPRAALSTEVKG